MNVSEMLSFNLLRQFFGTRHCTPAFSFKFQKFIVPCIDPGAEFLYRHCCLCCVAGLTCYAKIILIVCKTSVFESRAGNLMIYCHCLEFQRLMAIFTSMVRALPASFLFCFRYGIMQSPNCMIPNSPLHIPLHKFKML